MIRSSIRIHPSADVSPDAMIGDGTMIWNFAQVRAGAVIGAECILAKGVYVEEGAVIGDRCKLQNNVSVYGGVTIEDGVFLGPHVCFTNDMQPRATNLDGSLKRADDWSVTPTLVRTGASIGANSTIRCGVTVGRYALIGSGSVVTKDVPAHALVYGNPARVHGYVCRCGEKLVMGTDGMTGFCAACGTYTDILGAA